MFCFETIFWGWEAFYAKLVLTLFCTDFACYCVGISQVWALISCVQPLFFFLVLFQESGRLLIESVQNPSVFLGNFVSVGANLW